MTWKRKAAHPGHPIVPSELLFDTRWGWGEGFLRRRLCVTATAAEARRGPRVSGLNTRHVYQPDLAPTQLHLLQWSQSSKAR